MTPQSAKAKGRTLCKKIKTMLQDWLPLESADIEVTSSGANGMDLKLSPAARMIFPYAVEAKNVEKLNLYDAWEQCKANATTEALNPLLITKRNGKDVLAVMHLNTLLELLYRKQKYEKEAIKASQASQPGSQSI